jgi:hypothetical protein
MSTDSMMADLEGRIYPEPLENVRRILNHRLSAEVSEVYLP